MNQKIVNYIKISNVAKKMLNNHIKYTSNISNIYTNKLLDKINSSFNYLEIFPYIGSITNIDYLENNPYIYRNKRVLKPYSILYHIEQNNIYIDYFINSKQNNHTN